MAPLKEADTASASPTAATTATTPASPAANSPNETPTRPQPVPLEISVTVNGARTVEGSDKREPFSESTQTVLVFSHGAVIRLATPLAPGQLVFLTNEKSKKEVVCQVLKSKSAGSASGYVELRFTEPSPGFWGLGIAGGAPVPAAAPVANRPAASLPLPASRVVAPALTPAAKIQAPNAATPPVAQIPASPKPAVVPPSPPAPLAKPDTPTPVSVAPVTHAASPVAPVPSPARTPTISAPVQSAPPRVTKSLIPGATTGPRDFANDIESVFSPAQASTSGSQKPTAPVVPPPRLPAASSPSTEELKQQAARLQEQLSTLLFTETHAAPQESSPVSSTQSKPAAPVAEVANKVLELAHETRKSAGPAETSVEPKPDIRPEPKPAPSARTPAFTSLDPKVEEVAIPAWLRPISQHAEMVVEEPPKSPEAPETAAIESAPAATPESEVLGSSSSLSEAAVFGGRLLGGDEAPVEAPAASGSKKGLFLGLAAALALLAGGGFWYYQHTHAPITDAPAAQSHVASVAAEPVASTNSALPSSTAVHPSASAAAPAAAPSAPANTSLAPPSTHNSTPAPATSTLAAAESRSNNLPATHPAAPQPEPPKKAAFGKVHLATPVIRGSVQGQASGEPLPSIDAPVASVGADALAAASHHKGPAAPLPVGGDVKPAQLIKSVAPMYPPMAKAQRIYGNVTLDALVDTSGNVAELKVLSGPPLLHRAALDAVKQWKYSPALLDGTPTSMHLTVTVQFRTQ